MSVAPQTAPNCPHCGTPLAADSPAGLCPRCLLSGGIESVPPAGESRVTGSGGGRRQPFEPPTPEEIAARFPGLEVLDLLGAGGMGAVYRVRQLKLDRVVALKVLPPEVGRDPAFAERFLREARTLARLNHPHIVHVHDFGQTPPVTPPDRDGEPGLFWFLMEYVDGVNLRDAMRAGVDPPHALEVVRQTCEALQFAHEHGVVHRDVKPENILLDARGTVKIADFGLAKLGHRVDGGTGESEDGRDDSHGWTLTGTRQSMGTPHYMAPEQVTGTRGVDHRADIYSLGVVFYELLTGELPLGRFEPPSHRVEIDVKLDEVVLRALEREPEKRWQKASDLWTAASGADELPSGGVQPRRSENVPVSVDRDAPAPPADRVRPRADGAWIPLETDWSTAFLAATAACILGIGLTVATTRPQDGGIIVLLLAIAAPAFLIAAAVNGVKAVWRIDASGGRLAGRERAVFGIAVPAFVGATVGTFVALFCGIGLPAEVVFGVRDDTWIPLVMLIGIPGSLYAGYRAVRWVLDRYGWASPPPHGAAGFNPAARAYARTVAANAADLSGRAVHAVRPVAKDGWAKLAGLFGPQTAGLSRPACVAAAWAVSPVACGLLFLVSDAFGYVRGVRGAGSLVAAVLLGPAVTSFGAPLLGYVAVRQIREQPGGVGGRIYGLPLAVLALTCLPLALLDAAIVGVAAGVAAVVMLFGGYDLSDWGPDAEEIVAFGSAALAALPLCVLIDWLLARRVWRWATREDGGDETTSGGVGPRRSAGGLRTAAVIAGLLLLSAFAAGVLTFAGVRTYLAFDRPMSRDVGHLATAAAPLLWLIFAGLSVGTYLWRRANPGRTGGYGPWLAGLAAVAAACLVPVVFGYLERQALFERAVDRALRTDDHPTGPLWWVEPDRGVLLSSAGFQRAGIPLPPGPADARVAEEVNAALTAAMGRYRTLLEEHTTVGRDPDGRVVVDIAPFAEELAALESELRAGDGGRRAEVAAALRRLHPFVPPPKFYPTADANWQDLHSLTGRDRSSLNDRKTILFPFGTERMRLRFSPDPGRPGVIHRQVLVPVGGPAANELSPLYADSRRDLDEWPFSLFREAWEERPAAKPGPAVRPYSGPTFTGDEPVRLTEPAKTGLALTDEQTGAIETALTDAKWKWIRAIRERTSVELADGTFNAQFPDLVDDARDWEREVWATVDPLLNTEQEILLRRRLDFNPSGIDAFLAADPSEPALFPVGTAIGKLGIEREGEWFGYSVDLNPRWETRPGDTTDTSRPPKPELPPGLKPWREVMERMERGEPAFDAADPAPADVNPADAAEDAAPPAGDPE